VVSAQANLLASTSFEDLDGVRSISHHHYFVRALALCKNPDFAPCFHTPYSLHTLRQFIRSSCTQILWAAVAYTPTTIESPAPPASTEYVRYCTALPPPASRISAFPAAPTFDCPATYPTSSLFNFHILLPYSKTFVDIHISHFRLSLQRSAVYSVARAPSTSPVEPHIYTRTG
jgi:hypothetical protein